MELKISNILVTGATGKIGRSLVPELVKAGYHVRAVQFDEKVLFESVEVFPGDVRDPEFAKKALPDMDAVIHLASVKENEAKFMETSVHGTFMLLDQTMKQGHIKQFIQAGSDARAGIFYNPRPCVIDENFPHQAYFGYYAFSKVLEEVMCEQYIRQYKLPVTILRFSWVHDEDDILAHCTLKEPNFGVPVWEELAVSPQQKRHFDEGTDGVAMLCHPDGRPGVRHIVGIRDVVQGCMKAIGNPSAIGEAFAITGPAAFSYDVLANYVSEKLDIPVVRFEMEGFHDFRHSLAKSRSMLGYDPEYDIIRIVDAAIEFRQSGNARHPLKYVG